MPVLILISIVTNTLVVIVLLKKHMRYPTNVFLAGIAFSDMFTGLSPLATWLHFYALGNYRDFVPYKLCLTYIITIRVLPTVFHTASIWITTALTIQRYVYVCHGLKARRWPCTIIKVVYCIIAIYVASILSHLTEFITFSFIPIEVTSRLNPNETMVSCIHEYSAWVVDHEYLYVSIYTWFIVICLNLIPCTVLVVLNTLLILPLRTAKRRWMLLLNQNERCLSMRLKDRNSTTRMLVVVVSLFLLAEIPLGTVNVIFIIQYTFEIAYMTNESVSIIASTIEFIILLTFPLNLCIYCGMSRQFRTTFKQLFKCQCLNINIDPRPTVIFKNCNNMDKE
ncbi:sex peptide receptor-like [Pecten maximus]|uniref:sex peptide receptor-like n=1 Tax=Pecten maximus TaxID=6579 RepID=UPI0014582A8B|nr:sex peptide receptor-like [Pecten maximus]